MEKITKQEVFDLAVKNMLESGKKSYLYPSSMYDKDPSDYENLDYDPDDVDCTCAYRSPDGLKCAAGAVIPDHLYSESMERLSIDQVINNEEFGLGYLLEHLRLLQRLQTIHDDCAEDTWYDDLLILSKDEGLSWNFSDYKEK